MHDNTDQNDHRQPTIGLPRQLAIAGLALGVVLAATGVALWLVAGSSGTSHSQPQATTSVQTPTGDLLRELDTALGPAATQADLEVAVQEWLAAQQQSSSRLVASVAYNG